MADRRKNPFSLVSTITKLDVTCLRVAHGIGANGVAAGWLHIVLQCRTSILESIEMSDKDQELTWRDACGLVLLAIMLVAAISM